ncbi:MAG TPA: GAF domain-containing protein [Trichocoleus sp.]|jgi:methyl-accepting chemotaxis protein PixJ
MEKTPGRKRLKFFGLNAPSTSPLQPELPASTSAPTPEISANDRNRTMEDETLSATGSFKQGKNYPDRNQTESNAKLQSPYNSDLRNNSDLKNNSDLRNNNPLLSLRSNSLNGNSQGSAPLNWIFSLASQMQQAETLETLLQTVIAEVQEQLRVDRTLVYRLQTERQGIVVAESLGTGYTPSLGESLPTLSFGADNLEAYHQQPFVALNSTTQQTLAPYQLQLLERFQVQASLSLPIWLEGQFWGLLVVQQCSAPRQWQEAEILLLRHVVTEMQLQMQPLEFRSQRQQKARMESVLAQILEATTPSSDPTTALANLCDQLRQFYKADRVAFYRFYPDWTGQFVAESVGAGWLSLVEAQVQDNSLTSAKIVSYDRCTTMRTGTRIAIDDKDKILQDTQGGSYRKRQKVKRINDIYQAGFSDCYIETLEKYQAKAYLIAPVFEKDDLWGLLAVYECSGSRNWQDSDVTLLSLLSERLSTVLRQLDFVAKLQDKSTQLEKQSQQLARSVEQGAAYSQLIYKLGTEIIQENFSLDHLLQFVVRQVRRQLNSDRLVLYRFNPDWSGEFMVEAISSNARSILGTQLQEDPLKAAQGGRYRQHNTLSVNDITKGDQSDFPVELLQDWGTQAYLAAPIFKEEQLWGLIIAFQNDAPRHWEEIDVNLLAQVGVQVGLALQQAEYLKQLREQSQQMSQSAKQGRYVASIVDRIRQSLDLQQVFRTTAREIRNFLDVDRVAIFKFEVNTRYTDGQTIAEDVRPGYTSALAVKVTDHCFSEGFAEQYQKGRVWAVADIYNAKLQTCYIEVLAQFQVRANLIIPLLRGEELWGLFCIHQCSGPRQWQDSEIEFAKQIAAQLNVAIQQGEYLEQLQQQSQKLEKTAERERLVTKIVERMRQSLDLQRTFKTTAREIRNFLSVDRVAVFKFDSGSDYNQGETVAEDVRPGYSSAIGVRIDDHCFGERYAELYRNGRIWAVTDIYQSNLQTCYIEILEQFQVRANLIIPLFKGEDLWGLFCIHQCSDAREWQEAEIEFAKQIAAQLNVAIQQGEFVERLQQQSRQLTEAAQREKSAKELLQQEVIQLLSAVRPALDGDLTVRAPITEDEVGTIAAAYNNTLGSLRQIVVQMQTASNQVAQTSQSSESAIASLTAQAHTQFHALNQALERVQYMANATQAVETNAQQVEAAVQQANQIVLAGDAAMDRTVEEMEGIRETVAETNQRLQRLSESSQKISRVVSLISNFTTQTHLLALNAAIEATRAGEYGRGFAVVADEVRSLARQSARAATEIEQLVQEIQAGTAEVSVAIETGIERVVSGTDVVNEARENLNAIMNATSQISQLVAGITQATQEQTQQCQSVTKTVTEVATIANKTSEDSVAISESFQQLLTMAQNLQAKSEQFKVD